MTQKFFLYILRCSDGSYYTGSTQDISQRVRAHNKGTAARYTSARRPVRLIYSETHRSEQAAVRRERQIKRWTRAKKRALVEGNPQRLKQLSSRKRRNPSP